MLRPLTLSDKPLFDLYASQTPTKLASYAFAPLYVWWDVFGFYWAIINDRFCVFAKQGSDYFMPIIPLGATPSERATREAYAFMLEVNRAKHIARIENVPVDFLPFLSAIGFTSTLKGTEYLYETESLIQLKGNRYKGKRASYNAFIRHHPFTKIQPYQSTYLGDCLALYDSWQQVRRMQFDDDVYQGMLDDSRGAHHMGLINYEELGLVGRIVLIDGQLTGYTFGYALNTEIFCVLFEVTDLQIKGLAQFLFREFCREQAAYRFINAMDDSGLENLKRVKLSYRPSELIQSYSLSST